MSAKLIIRVGAAFALASLFLGFAAAGVQGGASSRPAANFASGDEPLPPVSAVATTMPSGQTVVTDGLDSDGGLRLSVNRTRLITTAARLRAADQNGAAVTIGSADIASVSPVSPNSILVNAKKPGTTNLIIEDELGRRLVIDIVVEADLAALRQLLASLSPHASITATESNGILILRGHVPNLHIADSAMQIAGSVYTAAKIVNLLEVSGGQQVMLQVKIAEVSKSAMSQLGVNFGYFDGTTFIANNIGSVNPFGLKITAGSGAPGGSDPFGQTLGVLSPGANVQAFGNLNFNKSVIDYFINCLRENQLMRSLAEPNLTAISGEQASFQVGGQIPIPVPQAGSGGSSSPVITVQYQPYGVLLHFTPVVLGDGRIRLKIDPEVSELDNANAVTVSGFKIPAFTTRTVDTTVELADGQSFAIAGLLNNQVSTTADSLPGMGDLPILGTLFRSVQYQRNQTELVVIVTPRLVEALNPEQVTAGPGENWRYPTEADLFFSRDLGGEAVKKGASPDSSAKAAGPAPQFHGQYGFVPTNDTHVVEP